jgi:hypothetical protein
LLTTPAAWITAVRAQVDAAIAALVSAVLDQENFEFGRSFDDDDLEN